jgi:hypothetical protein
MMDGWYIEFCCNLISGGRVKRELMEKLDKVLEK